MPAEVEQTPGDARKRAVAIAEFKEFVHALEEFHSKADHHVLDALRVANNGRVDRVFSEADAHVLEIGAAGSATAPIIHVTDSPPSSPLVARYSEAPSSLTPTDTQRPPRSARRGKLRARDPNASNVSQQQEELASADPCKRQRTEAAAAAASGKKGCDGGDGGGAVPQSAKQELDWRVTVAGADKENQPLAARGSGRPPLPKRKKGGVVGGGSSTASSSPADADESRQPAVLAEPVRRSGRNSPSLPATTTIRAYNSRNSGGSSQNEDSSATGDSSDSSSDASVEIAELRAIKVSSMRVVDLKLALKKRGASVAGLKAVLQNRLEEAIILRISELEASLPQAAVEGDDEQEDVEEQQKQDQEVAPAAAARVSANGGFISCDPLLRVGRSAGAPGAALGPLTRLSMPRLSTESTVMPSPVRAPPFFGGHSEQQQLESTAAAVAVAGLAAAGAADAAGIESVPEGAAGAPESESGGRDIVEDLMDIASDMLESDDDDEKMEIETDRFETEQLEASGREAAAGPGTGQEIPRTFSSGTLEQEGEEGSAELTLAALPAATAQVLDNGGDGSGVVPVADIAAEVVPDAMPADLSGIMMEEGEEEEGGQELERARVRGDRGGLADEHAPEESRLSSGKGVAGADGKAAAVEVSATLVAVEEKAQNTESSIEDVMEIEESSEETSEGISPPSAPEDKPAAHSNCGDDADRYPCKTPISGAASSSSTYILSSGGSSIGNVSRNDSEVLLSRGSGRVSGSDVVKVGVKRARPLPAPETTDGSAGSAGNASGSQSGGSEKRPKTGKEKPSLQEIMSQMRKTYAKKSRTPGAASKAVNAGARKAAADFLAARKPMEAEPAAPTAVPSSQASRSDPPTAAAEAPAPADSATSTELVAAASGTRPSNLITTLHSFTSLLSKQNSAPVGKWDRLAAGAGASSNTRAVPALRKAEEARLLEERRARERAASRLRTQAAGTTAATTGKQQQQPTAPASGLPNHGERVGQSGVMARMGAAKVAATVAAGSKPETVQDKGVSSAGSVGGVAPPPMLLAPLRVTGMLQKLVPFGASQEAGAVRVAAGANFVPFGASQEAEAVGAAAGVKTPAASHKKMSTVSSSDLPEPFRRSEDLFAGGAGAAAAAAEEEYDTASVRSSSSTSSSCFSLGITSTAGGSIVSSSERVEMKIRDQRAKIAQKRQARTEKLKAEEARKKADLKTKELRDAARLEASRRARQEAETKIREQKAQRQAEVEQRRQQERVDKEARDARERQEREAKRLAAVAEAKAKVAQEGAATKALSTRKPEAAIAATAAAVDGKPVAVLKRVSPLAPSSSTAPASTGGRAVASAAAPSTSSSVLKIASSSTATAAAAAASGSTAPSAAGVSHPMPSCSDKGKVTAVGMATIGSAAAETLDSYEMSDHEGDTSESESDDETRERSRRAGKKIPAWAKGAALSEALKRQYAAGQQVDPDQIFPEVFTCELEAIFPVKKSKYDRRGSSANWAPDRVTPQEMITYKRSVGITKLQNQ